jgi:hypothetical protein
MTHTTDTGFTPYLANSKDKKTTIGLIPNNNSCSGMLPKRLYNELGQEIKDDKNKPIDLKCESSKCNGLNCYSISLTTAQAVNIDNYIKIGSQSTTYEYLNETTYEYPTASFDYEGFLIDFYCNGVQLDFPTNSIISDKEIGVGVKWSLKVPTNYSCIGEFTAKHNLLEINKVKWSNQFATESERYFVDFTDFDTSPLNNITSVRTDNVLQEQSLWNSFVDWFLGMFGVEPNESLRVIGYNKTWTGEFYDFDPAVEYSFTSTTYGFYNQTETMSLGISNKKSLFHFDFNQENDTTYIPDESINNAFATIVGNVTYNSTGGQDSSGALVFKAEGGNLRLINTPIPPTIDGITFTGWFKHTGSSTTQVLMGRYNGVVGTLGYELRVLATNTFYSFISVGATTFVCEGTAGALPVNEWFHLAWVYNRTAGNLTTYINNTQICSVAVTPNEFTSPTAIPYIGRRGQTNEWFFNGTIDELTGYTKPLTAEERLQSYNRNLSFVPYETTQGEYTSLIFYNNTQTFWKPSLGHSASVDNGGINISHPNLISYWQLNGNLNDMVGSNHLVANGTNKKVVNSTGINQNYSTVLIDSTSLETNKSSFDRITNVTMCTMFKYTNADTGGMTLMSFGSEGTGKRGLLLAPTSTDVLSFGASVGTCVTGTTDITDGRWHFACGTRNSTTDTLYVDGKIEAIGSNSGCLVAGLNSLPFSIGATASATNPSAYFTNGIVQDAMLFDKALLKEELDEIYKQILNRGVYGNLTLQSRTATKYNLSDNSLMAFWSFNNDNSTTAFDELGNYNGTYSNGAISSSNFGIIGNSSYFDGVDDLINTEIDNNTIFTQANGFTISSWILVKVSPAGTATARIFDKSSANTVANGVALWLSSIRDINLRIGGSNLIRTPAGSYIDNKWFFVATTIHANGSAIVYVDGKPTTVGTLSPTSGITTTTNLTLGNRANATDRPLNGELDEFRIYNRVLSPSEILDIYNLGSSYISDWTNWQTAQVVEDGIGKITENSGNFVQFRTALNSNSTMNTPYLLNYSIQPSGNPDLSAPNITIIYPVSGNNYSEVLSLNYTAVDDYAVKECWYSINGGVTNSSKSSTLENFSITATEGLNTWIVYCEDVNLNIASNSTTFRIDTTAPNIQYIDNTTASGSYEAINFIEFNLSVSDSGIGIKNYTTYLYNDSGLLSTSTDLSGSFTSLLFDDRTYYLNSTACDYMDLCNSTETRTILLREDATNPVLTIVKPIVGAVIDLVFPIKLTATDFSGIDKIWFNLNNGQNQTYTDEIDVYVSNGWNTLYAWANDTYGNLDYKTRTFLAGNVQVNQTCPTGYAQTGSYENGTIICEIIPSSGDTGTSTSVVCPEDVFGYYNPNLPSIKKTGCNTNKW